MTGCWDREEVNSLAIVTSAGFDRTKDGAVELTLEIAAPRMKQSGKAQSGDKKEGGGQTIIRTAVGKTAAEAQGRLQMMLPRTIYWGQLQLVVVGEALAKNGLREQFDYLVRDNEIRLRVLSFVTRGKVSDFFESPYLLEQTKADFLQGEATRVFRKPLTLNQLVQHLSSEENGVTLPFIDVSQERKGSDGEMYIKGYAVFNRGRMVGTITGESFLAAKWVMNQLKNDVQTVHLGEGPQSRISLIMITANSRLIPSRKEEEWQMNIRINSEFSVLQNTTDLVMADPKEAHKLETAMAKHIRELVEQTVEDAKRMRTDIFGFGEAIYRKNPKEWNKLASRWDRVFSRLKVKVEADVNLRRTGMNTTPLGLPQKEQTKP